VKTLYLSICRSLITGCAQLGDVHKFAQLSDQLSFEFGASVRQNFSWSSKKAEDVLAEEVGDGDSVVMTYSACKCKFTEHVDRRDYELVTVT
jgi:hypothetical protein